MKYYTVYGNCQGNVLALFLNSHPDFKREYQHIYLKECHVINEKEMTRFIDKEARKIDLFLYTPISDNFRGNYKFSSNYVLSQLRPDCIKISYPSLYYHIYDTQMTYLTDENDTRVSEPHDYHDKILIKMFMLHRHLTNNEIHQKYIHYINNAENFDEKEIQEAVLANYRELKRREDLLEADKRNHFVLKIADFLDQNYKKNRYFYTFNHPSKYLYRHMVNVLFGFLSIGSSEQNTIPDFDPHADFISGIIPVVRDQLDLHFEENIPLPSSSVSSYDYLNFYRKCDIRVLAKVGVYPLSGRFIFGKNWSVDEITHRWAEASDAEILLYRTPEEPEDPYIFFTMFVIRPQTITISVNNVDQKTVKFQVENQKSVYLKVRLSTGENHIWFSSDVQPISPGNGDPRKLSFGIAKLSAINVDDL